MLVSSSEDARRRLTAYLLSVIEDPTAATARRDEMAVALAKIEASARNSTELKVPISRKVRPKVSRQVLVGKKVIAQQVAATASHGSAWEGLINGSHHEESR